MKFILILLHQIRHVDGVVTSHIYNSKFPISVFVIVRPVGAALIYADRRTDSYDKSDRGFNVLRECDSKRVSAKRTVPRSVAVFLNAWSHVPTDILFLCHT